MGHVIVNSLLTLRLKARKEDLFMRCRVLYRNNKEVDFEWISRMEVRSGLVIIIGYNEAHDNSLGYVEVIEPLEKISLIKAEVED